jgi:hypothetical protein
MNKILSQNECHFHFSIHDFSIVPHNYYSIHYSQENKPKVTYMGNLVKSDAISCERNSREYYTNAYFFLVNTHDYRFTIYLVY